MAAARVWGDVRVPLLLKNLFVLLKGAILKVEIACRSNCTERGRLSNRLNKSY